MRLTIHPWLPFTRAGDRIRDPGPLTQPGRRSPGADAATGPRIAVSATESPSRPRQVWPTGLVLAGSVLLTVGFPALAHADTMNIALAASFSAVLDNIRNWLIGILGGIATVFLTIGGVRRTMAGGDPGEHEKAKEAFKAAGIGYGLAAVAPLAVEALKGIVGL